MVNQKYLFLIDSLESSYLFKRPEIISELMRSSINKDLNNSSSTNNNNNNNNNKNNNSNGTFVDRITFNKAFEALMSSEDNAAEKSFHSPLKNKKGPFHSPEKAKINNKKFLSPSKKHRDNAEGHKKIEPNEIVNNKEKEKEKEKEKDQNKKDKDDQETDDEDDGHSIISEEELEKQISAVTIRTYIHTNLSYLKFCFYYCYSFQLLKPRNIINGYRFVMHTLTIYINYAIIIYYLNLLKKTYSIKKICCLSFYRYKCFYLFIYLFIFHF